ncbi:MAG: Gfo/Idh/MocA family oxidoreductase [Pseudomonadota bacterium]
MSTPVRLAVAGAGLVGRRHAQAIPAAGALLAGIADPSTEAQAFAATLGVPWHSSLEALLAAGGVDGVILATPNALHEEGAIACVSAGVAVLVEKPIAATAAQGRRMVAAADAAGVPLAVGHHRRHNPIVARARALIAEGRLGTITAVHGSAWLAKPDAYFEAAWRREAAAGPVLVNLIHDIDLLQHLVGPIAEVAAYESRVVRGHAAEDTGVMMLRFAGGALGTLTVSDATVAPWSWELTARENPAYPPTAEDCYRIAGTHGALALPSLTLWTDGGARDWWAPIGATRFPHGSADPLVAQAAQFAAVARGEAVPLVSGAAGLAALEVIEAMKRSAAAGGAPMRVPGH